MVESQGAVEERAARLVLEEAQAACPCADTITLYRSVSDTDKIG